MTVDEVVVESTVFDSILGRVSNSESTFSIVLETGEELRFRHVFGRDAFRQLREAAHRFAEGVTPLSAPSGLRAYVDVSHETKVWCWLMGAMSLDDGAGELAFLKIQHQAPVLFEMILEEFKTGILHLDAQAEMAAIDDAKKE